MNEELVINRTRRRRRRRRRRILSLLAVVLLFLALLALALVVARSLRAKPEPPSVDPHAGQILVNDGASRDNTLAIIADYQKRYPGKIRLLGSAPVSACKNFSILLR